MRTIAATAIAVVLASCSSGGSSDGTPESNNDAEVLELASGTTDGLHWTAVRTEEEGHACVGFAVDGEPLGKSCDTDDLFPDSVPVLEYVGTVQQGPYGVGVATLAIDDAEQLVVTFDDGTTEVGQFKRSPDTPDGLKAAALVGPECVGPTHIEVTSSDGASLTSYDVPPATGTCVPSP